MDDISTFELDTTGVVERGEAYGGRFIWDDFPPLAKDYVKAALQSAPDLYLGAPDEFHRDDFPRFDDLAPEAIAMIQQDCASLAAIGWTDGAAVWAMRQTGGSEMFPALRLYLNDGGRVTFGVARTA